MTYSVHYRDANQWAVKDFTSQSRAQDFARAVGGRVNVLINLHQSTVAGLIASVGR